MVRDRWEELCKSVTRDDGLPTREVGHWTEEKLWFWNRYIEITTSAMVGHPKWLALNYVDLFCGPGICRVRESKRRIPGSALLAANAPKPFTKILLCEKDPNLADACKRRLSTTPMANRATVLVGDCNQRAAEIAALIPSRALTLAFVDPEGLDADFETIKTLSQRGRVDLLILFADAYDVVRNVDLYEQQISSQLDKTLGPDANWRAKWQQLTSRSRPNIRRLFADIYREQLKRLGYVTFGEKLIDTWRGLPLYRLIYASKHERGLEFWDKVTKRSHAGQKEFDF